MNINLFSHTQTAGNFGMRQPPLNQPVLDITPCNGGAVQAGVLAAQEIRLLTIALQEGIPVRFWAYASADVDVYVLDRFGVLVACDNQDGGLPDCQLTPIGSGSYLIKLVNCTNRAVDYTLHVA